MRRLSIVVGYCNVFWSMKLITKIVLLLLVTYIATDEHILIVLKKCTSFCNKNYCNISSTCRPLNRTARLTSLDIYFQPGVKLKAPIYIEIIAYKRFTVQYRPLMLKIKEELCGQLLLKSNPWFKRMNDGITFGGNLLDPCPLSGHRYMIPKISTYGHVPLVPVGEWRMDTIISKNINGSEMRIVSWSDYYDISPTSATEF